MRGRKVAPNDGKNPMRMAVVEVLTSEEARELLKIGKTKLYELTRRQMIPAYRIGTGKTSSLRYRRSDLLEWLYSQRV